MYKAVRTHGSLTDAQRACKHKWRVYMPLSKQMHCMGCESRLRLCKHKNVEPFDVDMGVYGVDVWTRCKDCGYEL